MVEQDLEIVYNESNGKIYKNIHIKPRVKQGIKGLEIGNHIVVEKTFPEGREITTKFGKIWSCGVKYKDELVSFIITNNKEHEAFKSLGGVGDKLKISAFEEENVNPQTGVKSLYHRLKFELVA